VPDEKDQPTEEQDKPDAAASAQPAKPRRPARPKPPAAEAEAATPPAAEEKPAPRRQARPKPAAAAAEEVDAPPAAEEKPAPRRRAARPKAAEVELPESPLTVSSYSQEGERVGQAQLPEAVFGVTPNAAVMHQAYLRQLANRRQGTAATKTRAMVRGGGAKPYRQKGTGRARHGSDREPSMVGGGTVFGPQPRSFAQRMPRKMRRLALRSALSVKAEERKVAVITGFEMEGPRTALMAGLFESIGVEDTALLVLATPNELVARSVSNLPWAKAILAHNLNLYDLFTHEHLLIAQDALGVIEETFAPNGGAS
jgi:large subunit ribosomal protein L4